MMNTSKERAPPSPPTGAFSFKISYNNGTIPATTATIENTNPLFDSSASHIESKLILTIEIPNSQDTTSLDHESQGPTPAAINARGVNEIIAQPKEVEPFKPFKYLYSDRIKAIQAINCT